eukprot:m.183506 g.183506  ORF g.183506 m.183506 type:complete len:306 (+) comp10496_c0_seq6:827-1744(+)
MLLGPVQAHAAPTHFLAMPQAGNVRGSWRHKLDEPASLELASVLVGQPAHLRDVCILEKSIHIVVRRIVRHIGHEKLFAVRIGALAHRLERLVATTTLVLHGRPGRALAGRAVLNLDCTAEDCHTIFGHSLASIFWCGHFDKCSSVKLAALLVRGPEDVRHRREHLLECLFFNGKRQIAQVQARAFSRVADGSNVVPVNLVGVLVALLALLCIGIGLLVGLGRLVLWHGTLFNAVGAAHHFVLVLLALLAGRAHEQRHSAHAALLLAAVTVPRLAAGCTDANHLIGLVALNGAVGKAAVKDIVLS